MGELAVLPAGEVACPVYDNPEVAAGLGISDAMYPSISNWYMSGMLLAAGLLAGESAGAMEGPAAAEGIGEAAFLSNALCGGLAAVAVSAEDAGAGPGAAAGLRIGLAAGLSLEELVATKSGTPSRAGYTCMQSVTHLQVKAEHGHGDEAMPSIDPEYIVS